MSEPVPSTPKWFATSLAVWTAILSLLPQVLATFGIGMSNVWVQGAIQIVSSVFTVTGVIWVSTSERRTLLPPKGNQQEPPK